MASSIPLTSSITSLLKRQAGGHAAVERLLDLSIGRIYRRDPGGFKVDEETLRHVADWLRAAISNDEPWLKNVDDQGRPKKLMKFGSVDAVAREADKAMLKASQRLKGVKLVEGDEELVEILQDGYYVVRLLTPSALDRESAEMQHCIGNGAYDENLYDEQCEYLSLRDPFGKPHATMEIENSVLEQLQGKQNLPPLDRYKEMLAPFIKARVCHSTVPAKRLGYVIDTDGVWHPVLNLPSRLKVKGALDLEGVPINRLPDSLEISGYLDVSRTNITSLPTGLEVDGFLDVSRTMVSELPADLHVTGDIHVDGTNIKHFPRSIDIGGDFYVGSIEIENLPDKVGKNTFVYGDDWRSRTDHVKDVLDSRHQVTDNGITIPLHML